MVINTLTYKFYEMKTRRKLVTVVLLLMSLFIVVSCENSDDVSTPSQNTFEEDELLMVAETNEVSSDVDIVVDTYFEFDEGMASKNEVKSEALTFEMLSCVTKTVITTDTDKTVTLDFGTGCELPNGNVLKGKIILNFAKNTDAKILTITKTFENFYHNEIMVEGQTTIVKTRENDNGYPQATHAFNKKLTWPDGEFYSRNGVKTREWVAGFDTKNWGDDVFLITGNWEIVRKNGTTITAEITTPLKREMACRFLVSGTIGLTKNENSGTLDFGTGTCDNVAVFTNGDGETKEIILRKRKH